jgi:hypothetical protein
MKLRNLMWVGLALSLLSCSQDRTQSNKLVDELGQTSAAVLSDSQSFAGFEASDATRLAEACAKLRHLSDADWARYCNGNPAYRWSLQKLDSAQAKTPVDKSIDKPETPTNAERRRETPAQAEALRQALLAEIEETSTQWGQHAAAGNLAALIYNESKLKVLYSDLRESADKRSLSQLPNDELAFVPIGDLNNALAGMKSRMAGLRELQALFGSPEVAQSITTLEKAVHRLDTVIASLREGTFHLARDELAQNLSERKAEELAKNREERIRATLKQELSALKVEYPSSEIPVILEAEPNLQSALETLKGWKQQGYQTVDLVRSYLLNTEQWLSATSSMMAEYTTQVANQSAPPDFVVWWARRIPDNQLESAILYSRTVWAGAPITKLSIIQDPADPIGPVRAYFTGLLPALEGERERRKSGAKPDPFKPSPSLDASVNDAFKVQLSLARWGSLDSMPPALRTITVKAVSHEQGLREQDALSFYSQLLDLQNQAEARSEPLPDSPYHSLGSARAALLALLLRLENISAARARSGFSEKSRNSDGIASIIATLRLDPPNEPGPVGPGPRPKPSDGGGTLGARGPPTFSFRDPLLVSLAVQVRDNLRSASEALGSSPAPKYEFASATGRRWITEGQALSRSADFPEIKTDFTKTRLPQNLGDWVGFVDENKRPFSAEIVRKGERLYAIPGGIVMAMEMKPDRPSDFSSFVLTYDAKSQRLALISPHAQVYYSQQIAPEALKAINAFVGEHQTIAASIGWAGRGELAVRGVGNNTGNVVLLDKAFVDTSVGRDLIRADSIPWKLDKPAIGGWRNPVAAQFAAVHREWENSKVNALTSFVSDTTFDDPFNKNDDPSNKKFSPRFSGPISGDTTFDDLFNKNDDPFNKKFSPRFRGPMESYCSIGRDTMKVILSNTQKKLDLHGRDLYLVVDQVLFKRRTMATLYDKGSVFSLQPGKLTLKSELEYRYVTSKVRYGETVQFGKCLGREPELEHLVSLESLANQTVIQILSAFPSVRKVSQYGQIAAFLRWARQPGRVKAVDFYALSQVRHHDSDHSATADEIRR